MQQSNNDTPGPGVAVLTSEANAYGLGWGRWFDGMGDILSLINGTCEHKFLIREVNDYQYKGWGCSDESYYECLGSRFARRNFALQNVWCNGDGYITHHNGGDCHIGGDEPPWQGGQVKKCNFSKMCTTRSLPKQSGEVPLCYSHDHDYVDELCSNFVLHLLKKNQQGHCKKACSVMEFRVKDETDREFECLNTSRFSINNNVLDNFETPINGTNFIKVN